MDSNLTEDRVVHTLADLEYWLSSATPTAEDFHVCELHALDALDHLSLVASDVSYLQRQPGLSSAQRKRISTGEQLVASLSAELAAKPPGWALSGLFGADTFGGLVGRRLRGGVRELDPVRMCSEVRENLSKLPALVSPVVVHNSTSKPDDALRARFICEALWGPGSVVGENTRLYLAPLGWVTYYSGSSAHGLFRDVSSLFPELSFPLDPSRTTHISSVLGVVEGLNPTTVSELDEALHCARDVVWADLTPAPG